MLFIYNPSLKAGVSIVPINKGFSPIDIILPDNTDCFCRNTFLKMYAVHHVRHKPQLFLVFNSFGENIVKLRNSPLIV